MWLLETWVGICDPIPQVAVTKDHFFVWLVFSLVLCLRNSIWTPWISPGVQIVETFLAHMWRRTAKLSFWFEEIYLFHIWGPSWKKKQPAALYFSYHLLSFVCVCVMFFFFQVYWAIIDPQLCIKFKVYPIMIWHTHIMKWLPQV